VARRGEADAGERGCGGVTLGERGSDAGRRAPLLHRRRTFLDSSAELPRRRCSSAVEQAGGRRAGGR
jgi:hypothetical protein